MMKSVFVCISVVIFSFIIATNSYGEHYWAKTYGGNNQDEARSIQQTSDGGFVVAGITSSSGNGSIDFLVVKLTSDGDVSWSKTYGAYEHDWGFSLQETLDRGYIMAGTTYSFGGLDNWVVKLDDMGNIIWQKTYVSGDDAQRNSIQQMSDGGYILVGSTKISGSFDIWILKLNEEGEVSWEKTYGSSDLYEFGRDIKQTADGGLIVAGDSGAGILVMKLDEDGNVIWEKRYWGSHRHNARSIQQTSNGYVVAGYTDSFGEGDDYGIWILKLDDTGNISWQKLYDGIRNEYAYFIQKTSDGGYVVAGDAYIPERKGLIIKLDEHGEILWQKAYGTTDGFSYSGLLSVQQIYDDEYIAAGITSNFGAGSYDFFVLKTDINGEISNCEIVDAYDAIVSDTTAGVLDTYFSISSKSPTVTDTDVIPEDSFVQTMFVCCYDSEDYDCDVLLNEEDNCPYDYNPIQEDTYPPQGNGIGDACDCECDFDCNGAVEANDVVSFLADFGRSEFNDPCTNGNPCNGDVDCDGTCDAEDVTMFLQDFGRNQFNEPCPECEVGEWCVYP